MCLVFFLFKQKTAYEMRISDWSSDVCSSDLLRNEECVQFVLQSFLELILRLPRTFSMGLCHGTVPVARTFGCELVEKFQFSIVAALAEIGRASCRERVCQYV